MLISKRQVVRLMTTKPEIFRGEDESALRASPIGDYTIVDETEARHAGKTG